jgi:hypothetical protein
MGQKYISRIDSKDTHGWFFRYYNPVHSKFFSDSRYGSKDAALEAAKQYRAEFAQKYPRPAAPGFRTKLPKNNTSGVVGVSESYTHIRSGSRKKVPCFTVTWRPKPNVTRVKKFTFTNEHDREKTLKEAIAFRKSKEREMLERRQAEQNPPERFED